MKFLNLGANFAIGFIGSAAIFPVTWAAAQQGSPNLSNNRQACLNYVKKTCLTEYRNCIRLPAPPAQQQSDNTPKSLPTFCKGQQIDCNSDGTTLCNQIGK